MSVYRLPSGFGVGVGVGVGVAPRARELQPGKHHAWRGLSDDWASPSTPPNVRHLRRTSRYNSTPYGDSVPTKVHTEYSRDTLQSTGKVVHVSSPQLRPSFPGHPNQSPIALAHAPSGATLPSDAVAINTTKWVTGNCARAWL